jgi:hypothetical protein
VNTLAQSNYCKNSMINIDQWHPSQWHWEKNLPLCKVGLTFSGEPGYTGQYFAMYSLLLKYHESPKLMKLNLCECYCFF